ncbi:MAG: DNA cytosine methyltransferase, partial [Actinomycetota bacterium]|nr:DNA cytosine methyltransferase [Actinomycetota bacterium]
MTKNGRSDGARRDAERTVVDLFSGAGGASYGFHARDGFRLVGAADAQKGKPSSGAGTLQCNLTYAANIGIEPVERDLAATDPAEIREAFRPGLGGADPDILISCAPCTGFTRTNPNNHLVDDARNSLAARSALFVREFRPAVFVMENVREMVSGRFKGHYADLRSDLEALGYRVRGEVRMLSRYGLPQHRERALVIAARDGVEPRLLDDLWDGWGVR